MGPELDFRPVLPYSVWLYSGVVALSVDIPGTLAMSFGL